MVKPGHPTKLTLGIKKYQRILIYSVSVLLAFGWGVASVTYQVFPYQLLKSAESKLMSTKSLPSEAEIYELNKYWAKEVIKGGYILHFRHGQREKWTDVTAFDAYELIGAEDASEKSYARAVCLTPQGIEESRLIGEIFDILNVKVDQVISSPSCRARQTAQYAFGKIDKIENSLLHSTAITLDQRSVFGEKLRELLRSIRIKSGSNIILSGHGNTLSLHGSAAIDIDETENIDDREEAGFVVLEKVGNQIIARYKFKTFNQFANSILDLPLD
jgi:phosphohistidine phosphatase SixA